MHKKTENRKNKDMIDIKSKLVLKILATNASDGGYKIVEVADIIMSLPKRYRMDSEAVKHILLHLERQDIISIKYDDDGVYCLAVLPYGFEILENEKVRAIKKNDKHYPTLLIAFLSFTSALFGCVLGVLICFVIAKFL